MMYRIFGESPTIKIVEWLIEHQEFDHSLVEIAEGVKLSAAVAKRNFEPLIKYHVVMVRSPGAARKRHHPSKKTLPTLRSSRRWMNHTGGIWAVRPRSFRRRCEIG
ncbi:MAG: hypothetical protein JRI71_10130 [Deltaproteobacteria bacterium]|nr:hypothetical protein [Deltaproteobacteria bacterium]